MLSVDPRMLEKGSAVRARTVAYGSLVEELSVVLYTKPGFKQEKLASNVTVYPTNSAYRFLFFFQAYRLGRKLIKPGTLVTSQDGITNFVAVLLKWFYDIPLQVQIHTDFMSPYFLRGSPKNFLHYLGYRLGIAYADCVRVVSTRITRSIKEAGWSFKREPFVLPIFVDAEHFRTTPASIDLHVLYPNFETITLMLSRLEPEKNITLALEAFAKIVSNFPKLGLVIVGEGSERAKLERCAASLGIRQSVVFAGWQHDLVSYYKTADIFLSTSNYEGYGMSLVEARAAGCPIVTTEVGVVGEKLIAPLVRVCPVGDTACVAKNLQELIADPDLRRRISSEMLTTSLALPRDTDEYLELHRDLLTRCFDSS